MNHIDQVKAECKPDSRSNTIALTDSLERGWGEAATVGRG